MIAPTYVGASITTSSPGSRNDLETSSRPSMPPLVIMSSSSPGRRPWSDSRRPATASRVPARPCVGAYWNAAASTDCMSSATRSAGNVSGSGKPPANEIRSGFPSNPRIAMIPSPPPTRVRSASSASQECVTAIERRLVVDRGGQVMRRVGLVEGDPEARIDLGGDPLQLRGAQHIHRARQRVACVDGVRTQLALPRRAGLDQLPRRDRLLELLGVPEHAHRVEPRGNDVVGKCGELVQILEAETAERDLRDPHGKLRELEERPVVEPREFPDERLQEPFAAVVEARRARIEEAVKSAVPALDEDIADLAENRCALVEELEPRKQRAELGGVHLREPRAVENGHAFLQRTMEGEVEAVRVGVGAPVDDEIPAPSRLEVRIREVECSRDKHEVDRLLTPEHERERKEGRRHG